MPVDPLAIPLAVVPHLLEVSAVARRLNRSHDFVRQLIYGGELRALRVRSRWMIDPLDFDAYLEACRASGEREAKRLLRTLAPRASA